MNNLSQDCIEQIYKASANYLYPATFMAGGKTALTNPTIYQSAGLMSVEEAEKFMEWRYSRDWELDSFSYTTTELLTIFRNQNQER